MRIDKFLKVSRLIKRRSIAKEISDNNRVDINGKQAKASSEVNVGDVIVLHLNARVIKVKVLEIKEFVKAEEAERMYEFIQ
jgi:ribosomal 50S subunit-recycling heat shock protein